MITRPTTLIKNLRLASEAAGGSAEDIEEYCQLCDEAADALHELWQQVENQVRGIRERDEVIRKLTLAEQIRLLRGEGQ